MAILNSVLLVCGGANAGKSHMIRRLISELCGQLGCPAPTGNRIPRICMPDRIIVTRVMSLGDLKESVDYLVRDLVTAVTSTGDRREGLEEFMGSLRTAVARPKAHLVDYLCAARPSQCAFPNGAVSPDIVETCSAIRANFGDVPIKIVALEPPYKTMPRRFRLPRDYYLTAGQRQALGGMSVSVTVVDPRNFQLADLLRFFGLA